MKKDNLPRCVRCGRVLKSKESIERGMGSSCATKKMHSAGGRLARLDSSSEVLKISISQE